MDMKGKTIFEVGKLYRVAYKPSYSSERDTMVAFNSRYDRTAGVIACKANIFMYLENDYPWEAFYSISEKIEIAVGSSWAKNNMEEI